MELPTKENTLYLPIRQIYFDQIVEGTKKTECREIKEGITANRYLLKDEDGRYALDESAADPRKEYFIDDYKADASLFSPVRTNTSPLPWGMPGRGIRPGWR